MGLFDIFKSEPLARMPKFCQVCGVPLNYNGVYFLYDELDGRTIITGVSLVCKNHGNIPFSPRGEWKVDNLKQAHEEIKKNLVL